jgi:hypothetical protein
MRGVFREGARGPAGGAAKVGTLDTGGEEAVGGIAHGFHGEAAPDKRRTSHERGGPLLGVEEGGGGEEGRWGVTRSELAFVLVVELEADCRETPRAGVNPQL